MLQAVGVLAVATVFGTAAGLDVSGAPWLRPDGAQESGGVRGACTHFHVVGLEQSTTLLVPVVLQGEDDFLKGQHGLWDWLSPTQREGMGLILCPRHGRARPLDPSPQQDQGAQSRQWPQTPTRCPLCKPGGGVSAPFYRGHENAHAVSLQLCGHLALVVNHGGHAGVGGPHHGALHLHAAQAGNVEVLVYSDGVTKPSNVADVDHHGGGATGVDKAARKFFAKQIFIANMGGDALPLPIECGRVWDPTACSSVG